MSRHAVADRTGYLFRSTNGLVLVAIGAVALVTAVFGTLSGPMAEWGVKDITVDVLGMDLVESEREGRIIMLYHTIAMAVVAVEVYFITALVRMRESQRTAINGIITVGWITAMVSGLGFAYWGHNFALHGIYLFGLSLVFFAGLKLCVALWPWAQEHRVRDTQYAHSRGMVDLERAAFFTMAVATLISAVFGAVAGANYGTDFETFLAEDTIREPDKTSLQLAVIGHLHIMLALMGVAVTLIVGRWLDFKGALHRVAMPCMIVGTAILAMGVWAVVPYEEIAHYIIYGGSTLVMFSGLLLVIYGWRMLIHRHLDEAGLAEAGFGRKVRALVHDPLPFGALWQMVFMNFTVSGVGIYVAVTLDNIRTWPWRDERTILTGHWHILSAIIATIILLYFGDRVGLQGRARRWFGWTVIVGSDLAFAAVTVFSLKRLFVSESDQQPVTDVTMLLTDLGLMTVLVVLAAFLVWQLVDLGHKRGRWVTAHEPPRPVLDESWEEPRPVGVGAVARPRLHEDEGVEVPR